MTLKLAPGDTVTLEYAVTRIGQDCVMLRPKGGQYDLSMDYERVKSSLVSHGRQVRVGDRYKSKYINGGIYVVKHIDGPDAFVWKEAAKEHIVYPAAKLANGAYFELLTD